MLYALLSKVVLTNLQWMKAICLKVLLIFFWKKYRQNFIFVCTFSSRKVSQVVDNIIPYDPLINSVYLNWYLDFDYNLSSQLSQADYDFYEKLWNLGIKSFETFIKEQKKMKPISKFDKQEVLNQRNFLLNANPENIAKKK